MMLQEKLFTSKNRSEASLGKKLKIDMLPEIEKVHKVLDRAAFTWSGCDFILRSLLILAQVLHLLILTEKRKVAEKTA